MSGYRPLAAVVLAAGEGTRMKSSTPKVLHPLCGRPMLLHVVDTLAALPLARIVIVVGHDAERVTKTLQEQIATTVPIEFVEQRVQRGTGDATSVALTAFPDELDGEDDIIVMPGDAPLVRRILAPRRSTGWPTRGDAALRSSTNLPTGRVVASDKGQVDRIVRRTGVTDEESPPTRSTSPSTASVVACSRRHCVGSAPRTRRASTTSPTRWECSARRATSWSRCRPRIPRRRCT
jgi:bifunctional UDP-N-acetylglucosamine pyrophosphorylase/glucosamine-1-phosphate N-acetyltransferase